VHPYYLIFCSISYFISNADECETEHIIGLPEAICMRPMQDTLGISPIPELALTSAAAKLVTPRHKLPRADA